MALRSSGRKLSFDVLNGDYGSIDDELYLYRSISEPVPENGGVEDLSLTAYKPNRRKRKNKGSKKKKKMLIEHPIDEDPITEKRVDAVFDNDISSFYGNGSLANGLESDYRSYRIQTVICEEVTVPEQSPGSVRTFHQISEPDFSILHGDRNQFGELRQRGVNGSATTVDESVDGTGEPNGSVKEESFTEFCSSGQHNSESNRSFAPAPKLETAESLDWKQLISKDSSYHSSLERSPVKYFMEEMCCGNTLRKTTALGNEKDRERVYDTIFRLPWRCELLIDVGFFVCLDSFLSLLTIMPARILMTLWRFLRTRQFQRPCSAELSDFGCFIILAFGVTLLQQTDISLIYHMIRGQGTIKLYVVYNVLEIFDRLCQNIVGDLLQTMFSSAKGLASSPPEKTRFWLWRFLSDQALTVVSSIIHSFVLLAQAITLSTCIVSHNNALLALLVSNNFTEIKSNVFKRFSKDNIHMMVYYDSVERFHISAFILFVLAQNILEAEGPWFGSFLSNTLLVFVCEMMIDVIKHSFIAKFNEVKPIAYSEFLEALCKQTLNSQPDDGNKSLTFIPLGPACVVIRVLTPVYAVHLPCGPLPWRLLWVFLLTAMTYVMLASLKMLVGMGLHKHATWYVDRCQKRKRHLHFD